MINLTDLDIRFADHAARLDLVNCQGWLRDASTRAGVNRTRGTGTVVALVRRRMGGALVRVGVRLQGSPFAHPASPVA